MNIKVCIVLVGIVVLAHAASYKHKSSGYGKKPKPGYVKPHASSYGKQQSSGYGKQQSSGYGKQQSSGYGKQSYGRVNYNLKYNIDLPKDNHGSQAAWEVQDDAKNANYNLKQSHPYGAQSNIYYTQQNNH